ncbi:MAG: chalcone isomerase family protein [Solirubrobacterales bacterium]
MRTTKPTLSGLLLGLLIPLATLSARPAAAGTLADVTLPDRVDAGGKSLVLNGMGLRKKFFIKVYVSGLYLPAKEKVASKILAADEPRRMVLHFVYSVSAEQMCDAWKEGLADNAPQAPAEIKTALCGFMEPIDKGKELVLTYTPGEGTKVEVNGKVKGTIPGKVAADAILSTWIGPKPGPGEDFKKAVLGAN